MAGDKDITALFGLIHEVSGKVDNLRDDMSDLSAKVVANIAECGLCRPIVMGNGQPPLTKTMAEQDKRIVALETARAIRSKFDWVILGGVFTMAAALVKVVGDWLPRWLGW